MSNLTQRRTWTMRDVLDRLRDHAGTDAARHQMDAAFAFAIRVVSAVIAFGSQVFLARVLGTYEFGVFTYVWLWVVILGTLAPLGSSTSVVRFLPEFRVNLDWARYRGFLNWGQTTSLAAASAVSAIGMLALYSFQDSISAVYFIPAVLALATLPAFALTEFYDGVGRAESWIDLALGPPYIVRPILLLIIMVVALALGADATAETAMWSAIIATYATVAIQYYLQTHRLKNTPLTQHSDQDRKSWINVSLPLFVLDGLTLVMLNIDLMLLNFFITPDQLGIYFAASRLMALVCFVHFAVSAVSMPRFAAVYISGNSNELSKLMTNMRHLTFWPSFVGTAIVLVLGQPLLTLFGPSFIDAYSMLFVFAVGHLAKAAAGPVQALLSVAGAQRQAVKILVATCLLALVLNILLIPKFGAMGAAMAMSAAFVVEAILGTLIALKLYQKTHP
ncbi:MAG: multi antimicrobial extrusion protein MatE [Hyphomicrobium sp.]|nr:MAG: multi antimicrobial extrusion protein MatE [Hyphomicrobium sp.]